MNAGRTLALATLVVIAIAGPASARQTEAADGYVFQRKEWVQWNPETRIVEHASHRELLAAMPEGTRPRGGGSRRVQAWSNISADRFCEIHIVDPSVSYAPEAIGHELVHCIYGRWHD